MKLYLPNKPNLIVLTLNPHSRFHLYWLDCGLSTAQSLIPHFQQFNIAAVNMGYALSAYLQNRKSDKYLSFEVEEFVRRELEFTAKPLNGSTIPVVALYNIGILFEPAFHFEPARFLKDISKHIGIILLWEDEVELPGRFFWNITSKNDIFLDFTDANIQQINLEI